MYDGLGKYETGKQFKQTQVETLAYDCKILTQDSTEIVFSNSSCVLQAESKYIFLRELVLSD